MDREKSVCFTGHRIIPAAEKASLLSALYSAVMDLYLEGYNSFICGGAMGFDTLAAECVLAMKERFPEISLSLFLPCRDQTEKWDSLASLKKYKEILGAADSVEYISDFYTDTCMHDRNRHMVDSSSVCVAYLNSVKGGTAYTVKYAEKQGLRIINLAKAPDQLYFS